MADQRKGIYVNEMKSMKLSFITVKIKKTCKTHAFLGSVRKITGSGFLPASARYGICREPTDWDGPY